MISVGNPRCDCRPKTAIGAGPKDPVINGANIAVSRALAVALGLRLPVANDGTVTFNKDTLASNPAGFL